MHFRSKNRVLKRGGRCIALLLVLLLAVMWSAAPVAAADKVLGVREELPNHLVWLFSRQAELPLVTLQLLIKAGALQDPQGKEGLANLTASLLLSGTNSRSATQVAQSLDFMGAKLRAGGGR